MKSTLTVAPSFVFWAMLSSDRSTPELHRLPVSASHDQWSVTWLAGCWMIWYRDWLLLLGYPDVDSEYFYTEFLRRWIILHWIFWDIEFFHSESFEMSNFFKQDFLRHWFFLHWIFEMPNFFTLNILRNHIFLRWFFLNIVKKCHRQNKFSARNSMAFKIQSLI